MLWEAFDRQRQRMPKSVDLDNLLGVTFVALKHPAGFGTFFVHPKEYRADGDHWSFDSSIVQLFGYRLVRPKMALWSRIEVAERPFDIPAPTRFLYNQTSNVLFPAFCRCHRGDFCQEGGLPWFVWADAASQG